MPDAAEALVLERGFRGASVQAIAEQAGTAKGAVYLEFPSKTAILEALLEGGAARVRARAAELLPDHLAADGHAAPLSAGYRAGVLALLDDPLLCAAFLDDESVLGTTIDGVRDGRYRTRHDEAVVDRIAALQAEGALSSQIPARDLGLALSSLTLGLLTAARHLGPLERHELEGALLVTATLVEHLEPHAARQLRANSGTSSSSPSAGRPPRMRAPEASRGPGRGDGGT